MYQRNNWAVVALGADALLLALTSGCAMRTSDADTAVGKEHFAIECRFVRGDELVGRLGVVTRTRGEHDVVYVVGCVTNRAPRMGYIRRARITAPQSELHGDCDLGVGLIPPNGQSCVPFVARFDSMVPDSIDVRAIVPEVEIQEVLFK